MANRVTKEGTVYCVNIPENVSI